MLTGATVVLRKLRNGGLLRQGCPRSVPHSALLCTAPSYGYRKRFGICRPASPVSPTTAILQPLASVSPAPSGSLPLPPPSKKTAFAPPSVRKPCVKSLRWRLCRCLASCPCLRPQRSH